MKHFFNRYILLRHLHLQSRLMIYFSLLTILPLYVVTSVNYQSAERTIKKNAIEYTSSKLQQAINSVDVYIENADGILKSMFFDKNLRQYIYSSQSGHFQRTIALSKVQAILAGYIYPAKYIAQVYIVDNDEQIFASNAVAHDLLEKESWFTDFRDGTDIRTIVPTHDAGNYVSSMGSIDIAITILRKYVNIEKNEPLGVVGIDINYQYISDVFERTGANKDTTNLLITEQGEVVYDNNPNLISKAIDGKMYQQVFQNKTGSYMEDIGNIPYIVVYTTSNETNWKLIQFIPVSELFAEARKIKTDTFIVGLMCILFSMLISIGVSYSVSAPLKKLRREMTKVEKGDMNVHIEITSGDEIGELSNSFNRMIKELSASIKKIYEDEGIKKQIELNMLQQQINPHFLFNTLDSINWMARMQNVPNISSTITSLVKLLQASTYTNRDFVHISEEIDNIKNYIAIQKFRYGSRIDVIYDVSPSIMKNYTLKLILQPLVENAIYHGLEDKIEGGIITIGGVMIDEVIYLSVEDNGKGIDQEKFDQILSKDCKEKSRYSSIGISNTAKRIKLYYGDEYGLELSGVEKGGTRIVIKIPVRSEERERLGDQSVDRS